MIPGTTAHIIGLQRPHGLIRDRYFWLFLFAGLPVALYLARSGIAAVPTDESLLFYVSLILWFPVTEELAFRGVLQGLFLQTSKKKYLGDLSTANLQATLVFLLFHLLFNPSLIVTVLIFPSLVYGAFRDRHNSLVPPLILHTIHNGCLVMASFCA
ncbi:MAG: JDVT-CTERM system glutamic-type intramembrane protease MrtJ [Pseudomonadota bacterium]